jgi:hypothetical protein
LLPPTARLTCTAAQLIPAQDQYRAIRRYLHVNYQLSPVSDTCMPFLRCDQCKKQPTYEPPSPGCLYGVCPQPTKLEAAACVSDTAAWQCNSIGYYVRRHGYHANSSAALKTHTKHTPFVHVAVLTWRNLCLCPWCYSSVEFHKLLSDLALPSSLWPSGFSADIRYHASPNPCALHVPPISSLALPN